MKINKFFLALTMGIAVVAFHVLNSTMSAIW